MEAVLVKQEEGTRGVKASSNSYQFPKIQRCNRWSLGMDQQFHPTLYQVCDYISVLGLKSIHVSIRGPRDLAETERCNFVQKYTLVKNVPIPILWVWVNKVCPICLSATIYNRKVGRRAWTSVWFWLFKQLLFSSNVIDDTKVYLYLYQFDKFCCN